MPRELDSESKKTLGLNLREARGLKKWTQQEAADEIGVRRDRLNRWEMGREAPGAEGLLLLAIGYQCLIDQLLSGVDERYDNIIESRVPLDAQQHYRARMESFIRRTTAAIELLKPDVPVHAPTPTASGDTRGRASGRSTGARVRKKR